MKVLFIISLSDGESIYNAMRLANMGVEKGVDLKKLTGFLGFPEHPAGNQSGFLTLPKNE